MTGNEYQRLAARTLSPFTMTINDEQKAWLRLIEASMGLAGETGECADQIKKMIFQEHELDKEHLAEELGDVLWYIAEAVTAIGYDLDTIMQMNIEKLKKRYPDGFDADRSKYRDASMDEALK